MKLATRMARPTEMTKLIVLSLLFTLCGCKANTGDFPKGVAGSGSSFVYPLMVQWASEFEKREDGCKINYRSLGSGAGIKQITEKKVDFACTDAPMTDEEIAKARDVGGELVHIPLVMGAVVAAYNLPGATEPLRFSGAVLADIYLGKITKWNDQALQKLNPGVQLPDRPILVVHRRDDSGTTYIWTDFLSKVSPEWQKKVGTGHDITWPTGQAEVGNGGVAEYVKNTAGSLGYVELAYAHRKDIAFGVVQNREGEFVKPSLQSTVITASNVQQIIQDDLRYSMTNAPGKESYPICGTTWAVVYVHQPAGKGRELVAFLQWVLGEGQDRCEALFYARLPEPLVARAKLKLDNIKLAK